MSGDGISSGRSDVSRGGSIRTCPLEDEGLMGGIGLQGVKVTKINK